MKFDWKKHSLLVVLLALSAVGLAVRLVAARTVGFGDSEALYASYALFPAPAYLDHPGLIGLVARALGHGHAPSPESAHVFTAIAMTFAPWAVVAACRVLGATMRASLGAAIAVAVAPEIAVGLFGMTPDLVLFFAWMATVALFGRALLSHADSTAAAALFLGAGLALGLACAAKVSGLVLGLALIVTLAAPSQRAHARTAWPWLTFGLAALIFAPVLLFEAHKGWPMVHHRLIDTQHDASVSLRNAAATLAGQALYVSPVLAVAGVVLGRELIATRRDDPVQALLAATLLVPLGVLGVLCLWSRVAEPHWLAPAWLALPLYYAHASTHARGSARAHPARPPVSKRLAIAGVAVGLFASSLVYAWVLVPGLVAYVPRTFYEPKLDIANELFGWPEAVADVERDALEARVRLGDDREVAVVGSVWMVCAQLRAALPAELAVGCAGKDTADFATWSPKSNWSRAEIIVFVHDNRAPVDSSTLFPDRALLREHTRTIMRGGQTARVFTIEVLSRRAAS